MSSQADPIAAERYFFDCLLGGDVRGLAHVLAENFTIIDVMSGGEADRATLLAVVEAGQLKFESIEMVEGPRQRLLGGGDDVAVLTGRTSMRGSFAGTPFAAASRYAHVLERRDGVWRLVSAQGTPVKG